MIATCRPRLETARQATHRAEPQRPTDPSRGDRRMPRCRHLRPWNRCLAQARAEAQRRQAICPHASIHTKPKPTAEAQTSTGAGTLSMGSAALLGDLSSASDRDRRCGCLCVAPTIPGSTPSLILHAMLPEPPWLGEEWRGRYLLDALGCFLCAKGDTIHNACLALGRTPLNCKPQWLPKTMQPAHMRCALSRMGAPGAGSAPSTNKNPWRDKRNAPLVLRSGRPCVEDGDAAHTMPSHHGQKWGTPRRLQKWWSNVRATSTLVSAPPHNQTRHLFC